MFMMKKLLYSAAVVFTLGAGVVQAATGAFEYCMIDASKIGDAAIAECMKTENQRVSKELYKEFEAISQNPEFQKWNSGSGMFRGRLKDMYDNWAKYRDEYCDLYTFSMENYLGTKEYNMQRCLLDLTRSQLVYVKAIQQNRNSTPE